MAIGDEIIQGLGKVVKGLVGDAAEAGAAKVLPEIGATAGKDVAETAASKVASSTLAKGSSLVGTPTQRVMASIDDDFISKLPEAQMIAASEMRSQAIKATQGKYFANGSDFTDKINELSANQGPLKSTGEKVADALTEGMTNSMLSITSGPTNIVGSLGAPIMDEISKVIGRGVAGIFGKSNGTMGEAVDGLTSYVKDFMAGSEDATKAAWNTFKTGQYQFNPRAVTKTGYASGSAIQDLSDSMQDGLGKSVVSALGKMTTLPVRITTTGDEMVSQFVNSAVSKKLLRQVGTDALGMTGQDLDKFVSENFNTILNAPENQLSKLQMQIKNEAKLQASHYNFTQKLGTEGNTGIRGWMDNVYADFTDVVKKYPYTLGMIGKFLKAPYNAAMWLNDYCPFTQVIDGNFYRKLADPNLRELALGQFALGTAVLGAGAAGFANGTIIPMSTNKADRNMAAASGNKEGSIFGIPISNNIAFLQPLMLGAKLGKLLHENDLHDDDTLGVIKAAGLASLSIFKDANGLRDLSSIMSDISDNPSKAAATVGKLVQNLIPGGGIFKKTNMLFMEQHEANGILDQLMSRIPLNGGYSIDYKRDLFGRKVGDVEASANEAISRATREDNLSLQDSPKVLQGSSGMIDLRSITGKSGESLYAELKQIKGSVKIGGLTCSDAINKAINSATYKSLSNKTILGNDTNSPREQYLQSIMNKYNDLATKILRSQYTELGGAVNKIKIQQKAAKAGTSQSSIKSSIEDAINNIGKSGI